jgi:uncharacterized protein (TIGR00730 family)
MRAYTNLEFLNGPYARTIRILSEFLEPLQRFRREGIRHTIVIFGSARVLPRNIALKKLKEVRSELRGKKKLSVRSKQQLQSAEAALEMSAYYEDARKLTGMLTRWSMKHSGRQPFVVCSGGGPGIMEAANRGAFKAGGKSIGLNISLPFEQESNPYVSKNLEFEFHYFFMRKFWFVYLAKAVIMFPGGFGTLDELMEVLTLLQTKKVTKPLPVVLYGRKYWQEILDFDALVRHGVIDDNDLALFRFADTPEEAFRYLKTQLTKEIARDKKWWANQNKRKTTRKR